MPASSPTADRNLLYGILALQLDFISRDALIAAMHDWVLDKGRTLGQILVEQKALSAQRHALLEALVQEHLQAHNNDAEQSLAAMRPTPPLRRQLEQIADPAVQASLAHCSMRGEPRPEAHSNEAATVGLPTAAGTRFRILRPHARGGLGEVSVAHDQELHREVALKEIQERFADDSQSRSRFVLEAEITGGLEHPGVVPVYGLGAYPDGRPFYAMRLIKGDSLQEALNRFHQADVRGRDAGERSLALRQLLNRFVAVCNAVEYAHSRGVIHRDLKPANVMLGPYGETLVVDWGLAKVVGRGEEVNEDAEATLRPTASDGITPTELGTALGTPAFMSPEQAAGRLDLLGPASDVYGLGATLYALLTGKAPISGADKGAIIRQAQRGEFPSPRQVKRNVPQALEAICLKGMALKPDYRYKSAQALAADVERWLADEPVQAYPEPWHIRCRRLVRRHRTLATALTATLLAVLVVGGVAWVRVTDEQAARLEQEARLERAEREKADQRAERTRLAEAELRRAMERRNEARKAFGDDVAKWNEAFAAIKRAEGLLTGGEADKTLRAQVRKLLDEMEVEARDRRLLARLDEARLQTAAQGKQGGWDYAGASAQFAQAFRDDGLDILRTAPQEVARRLQRRAIKAQLVPALYDWLLVCRNVKERQRLLATIAALDPDPASFHNRWWKALGNRKELTRLTSAPEVRQMSLGDLARLGNSLITVGAMTEGVELLRKAWQRNPGDFWINYGLAYSLGQMGKPPWVEVIRFYTAALAIRPRSAGVHYSLGVALDAQQDLKGAIAAFRKAIAIKPKYAEAYNNLGLALKAQQDLKGAIDAFHKAIAINPKDAVAHNNLGLALYAQQDLKGAIAAFRKAIVINPRFADAYYNLGFALDAQGDPKGAIVAFRKAIEINPSKVAAYNQLGNALEAQQDLKGAIAAYRKAIEINPKYALAHLNLGLALNKQGAFAQALVCFNEGARCLPMSDPRRPRVLQLLRSCQRSADLEKKLPAILSGEQQPRSNGERIEYAQICQRKRMYASVAQLCEQAFAADVKLADDLKAANRYNAARAAALAAAGQCEDAAKLYGMGRSRWRKQAVAWLRADLAQWTKRVASSKPAERALVQQTMQHWQRDPDLAGIRDAGALAKLPPEEQTACKKLWADVAEMLQKAAKT